MKLFLYFYLQRSNIKESSDRRSRSSEHGNETRPQTGEPGIRSGELEQDDLYSMIEPNDILDLPRV
jgi:hypothetical protein